MRMRKDIPDIRESQNNGLGGPCRNKSTVPGPVVNVGRPGILGL